jgi:4-amino-4-deoxy-L-arabinose transferase-like glycosyltransferase
MARAVSWPALSVVATFVAAVCRLPMLGAKSLWYDEAISVTIARASLGDILRARLHIGASEALVDRLYTTHPPLHFLVIHGVMEVSSNDAAIRLPFALAGLATVPLLHVVAARLCGPPIGAAAALLLAVSPFHVAYSQEARPTAFLMLFALVAFLYLLRATETNGLRDWVGFGVASLFAIWTSYFAIFVVLPMLTAVCLGLLLPLCRRSLAARHRSWLVGPVLAYTLVAVGALPLIADFLLLTERTHVSVGEGQETVGSRVTAILLIVAS